MNFEDCVNEYIATKISSREKDVIKNLLLVELRPYLEIENVSFDISVDTLQVRADIRCKIVDALEGLLKKTTNYKDITRDRLFKFADYMKRKWKVELAINEVLRRQMINPYERLVDLLKTLNEGKTKDNLREYYNISRKPLEEDINTLMEGTPILGQMVKIREIKKSKQQITYESSVHPIFLPLTLTEVFYLTVGMKQLSKNKESLMYSIHENLANKIFCQLSENAKSKIRKKGRDVGVRFPSEDEYENYNGNQDEEKTAKENIISKILYLYKAGVPCTVHLNNADMTVIPKCYIDFDLRTNKIKLKTSLYGDIIKEVDINNILDIEFDYI